MYHQLLFYYLLIIIINKFLNYKKIYKYIFLLGIGGLGIGDWVLGPIPNPQSPIPNPQSPIPILKDNLN